MRKKIEKSDTRLPNTFRQTEPDIRAYTVDDMRGIEDMVEQNDNSFDGVINNVKAEPAAGSPEIVPDDKKSVLEKLREQSGQIPVPVPEPERKPVPGCCFEREITGW